MYMIRILSFGIFFLFGCNQKNHQQSEMQDNKLIVNKNYLFCMCVRFSDNRFILKSSNPSMKLIKDNSGEVYFIDKKFNVDIESSTEFVNTYLDSLESNNLYRSFDDSSLSVAKCLDLYNSKKLDIFLKKEFSRKE